MRGRAQTLIQRLGMCGELLRGAEFREKFGSLAGVLKPRTAGAGESQEKSGGTETQWSQGSSRELRHTALWLMSTTLMYTYKIC